MVRRLAGASYRAARKIVVAVIGATVIAIGAAMIVLPGPAFVVIPLGLAILSVEFAWARRWLESLRENGGAAWERLRGSRDGGWSIPGLRRRP